MPDKIDNARYGLPDWVTIDALRRVFDHYDDGAFHFDLEESETDSEVGKTVYHTIARYSDSGESVMDKLRRIMAHENRAE